MRLIDGDALFKEFERAAWYDNADRDEIAEEILKQMPTVDAVPVVRCKDCAVPHNKYTGCPELNGLVTPLDFYCPFGERKEEVSE